MKIVNYISDSIPTHALSYLVMGDSSGIEDSEVQTIDTWLDACRENLISANPGATVDLILRDGCEGSFTHHPAFGLACDCVPGAVVAMVENDAAGESMPLPWEPAYTPVIHAGEITSQDYIGALEIDGNEWHAVSIVHPSGVYLVAGTACNAGLLPSYARAWDSDYESLDECLQELIADIEEQETGGSPSGELMSWHGSRVI